MRSSSAPEAVGFVDNSLQDVVVSAIAALARILPGNGVGVGEGVGEGVGVGEDAGLIV